MKRFLIPALLIVGLAGTAAFAESEVNVSIGLSEKGVPLAAHGFDVVSYFTDGRAETGLGAYTAVHAGAAYRFVNEQHLRFFRENPEKYVPQYGGFCAFGAALGKKFDGNPRLFKIFGGRLFFNLNEEIQSKWETDVPGYVAKADANWRRIASKRPDQL